MATATQNQPPRPTLAIGPAILSYLVPGLGQIYQGRVAKGLLFMICLYALFFYGMALGQWRNVYIPIMVRQADRQYPELYKQKNPFGLPLILMNVNGRWQFAGQFWIGVAAWPALYHYFEDVDPGKRSLQAETEANQGFWRSFQRAPDEDELNTLQTNGDKSWDLAWVLTVIAGALNVLVIYDALAGPAFQPEALGGVKPQGEKPHGALRQLRQ